MLGPADIVREPPDKFVATVFKQGPGQHPGGVLGPHFLSPAEQCEKNWNDHVAMAKQFLASAPQHGVKPHADYGPHADTVLCDNCGVICTDSHYHGKIEPARLTLLADMCDGCMNAFRFMQFPIMLPGNITSLRQVVIAHGNDKEISGMSSQNVRQLASEQFMNRQASEIV
jgi:hypothetical protein